MSRHSATGAAWEAQRKRVLERDGWQCAYCGKALEGSDATVDHVEPISLDPGRVYADDALLACCRTCNGRKSDRPVMRMDWYAAEWFTN